MAAIHIRVGYPAENRKIRAVLPEQFQIRGQGVIPTAVMGKKAAGKEPEVVADTEHAARRRAGGEGW